MVSNHGLRNQLFRIECGTSENQIKEMVHQKWGIPPKSQTFIHVDRDCLPPFAPNSRLIITTNDSSHKPYFTVSNHGLKNQTFRVECGTSENKIKEMVHEKWGIPPGSQTFIYADIDRLMPFAPNSRLIITTNNGSHKPPIPPAPIRSERTKRVTPKMKYYRDDRAGKVTLHVHSLGGYRCTLEISRQMTVQDFKEYWHEIEALPSYLQRWAFNGNWLSDDLATLASLGLQNNDRLYVRPTISFRGDIGVFHSPSNEVVLAMSTCVQGVKMDI